MSDSDAKRAAPEREGLPPVCPTCGADIQCPDPWHCGDVAAPKVRDHHLTWNGAEWVDNRCGCRYHPDDDGGSHGGAPHVHRCERHAGAIPSPLREELREVLTLPWDARLFQYQRAITRALDILDDKES